MLSIPDELSQQLDVQLDGRNFSQYICKLIKENLGIVEPIVLVRPAFLDNKSAKSKGWGEIIKKTEKTAKVVKNGDQCPHYIMKGGRCLNCPGGIAR